MYNCPLLVPKRTSARIDFLRQGGRLVDGKGTFCVKFLAESLTKAVVLSIHLWATARKNTYAYNRQCEQFLMAVKGSVRVRVDDGRQREEFCLDSPGLGLHLPPMVWGTQYRYSEGAMLLVLASLPYDPADYIRDYGEFLALAKELA